MNKLSIISSESIYLSSRIRAKKGRERVLPAIGLTHVKQLQRIEGREQTAHPDTVLLMSQVYNDPLLPFEHCKHECSIGQIFYHDLEPRNLTTSVIQLTNAIDRAVRIKNRLLEIAEDEKITEDEIPDLLGAMQILLAVEHRIGEFKLSASPAIDLRDIMKTDPCRQATRSV